MNKIYKLKYDRRRNQVVAVSELTAGAGKENTGQVAALAGLTDMCSFRKLLGTLTPLAFLTGLVMSLLPGIALANPDLPTGGQIVAGQGNISTNGNQMTISQNTHGLVTNWNTFDVGQNHTVQFVQPDSSAVALNRVTGGHESQILGTLTANGQVMLVNPAGVMFGKEATVNTAGLVASTKNISNADFMAGHYTFSGGSDAGAEVVNQGNLTTTKGGFIVLAADRVKNSGTIITPGGKTVLAAGDKVTLQLDNTGLASVSVSGSVVNALVENSGLLSATDGRVYLTARGKDMLLNTVVNNTGTVEASGLSGHGGEIVLNGGDSGVVKQSGQLLADSHAGPGGKITVEGQNIHLAANSRTSATGKTGGGEVYVGGGWQGKDSRIGNASKVVMDRSATVDVSATDAGSGGTAVLWSDDYTNFRGTILAKGGALAGDGGRVETSSHKNLQAFGDVDTSASAGHGGNWLLDPLDVTIVSGDTNTSVTESGKGSGATLDTDTDHIFSPSASGARVSAQKIADQLNAGTDVTVDTHGDGAQQGNITLADNVKIQKTKDNTVSLTLKADKDIVFGNRGNIVATAGKLNLNLLTGGGGQGGNVAFGAHPDISLNGGDLLVGPANASGGNASMSFMNAGSINAGNITLNTGGGITGKFYSLNATENLTVTGPLSVDAGYNLTSNIKAGHLLNITADSGDISFTATKVSGEETNGKIIIEGNDGVNIRANNGHLVMNAVDKSKNTITVSSSNGDVNLTVTGSAPVNMNNVTISGQNVTALLNNTAGGVAWAQTNSSINAAAGNITIENQTGNSQNSWGATFNNGNLTALAGNITLNFTSTKAEFFKYDRHGVDIGGSSNFTATNVNITGHTRNSTIGAGINVNGASVVINATSGNIQLTGSAGPHSRDKSHSLSSYQNGMNIINAKLFAQNGNILLSGAAQEGTGLLMIGVTLNASQASIHGSNKQSRTGFDLTGLTWQGGLTDAANITLTSTGNGGATTNRLQTGSFTNEMLKAVMLKEGTDNPTYINKSYNSYLMSAFFSPDETSSDINANFKNVWIMNEMTLNPAGNISLQGVGFSNSTVTAGKNLSIDNGVQRLLLNGTNVSAGGNISLKAGAGISYTGSIDKRLNMTAGSDISLDASAGTVDIRHANLTSDAGNIEVSGNGTAGVVLSNMSLNATQGNITVTGEGKILSTVYETRGATSIFGNASFAAKNTIITGNDTVEYNPANAGVGVMIGDRTPANLTFSGGNVSVNGSSMNGQGVHFGFAFEHLTHVLNIHAKKFDLTGSSEGKKDTSYASPGGIAFQSAGKLTSVIFNLFDGAKLRITGDVSKSTAPGSVGVGKYVDGVKNAFTFNGTGDVEVIGKAKSGEGVNLRGFDNTGLTGNLSIKGVSESKSGVLMDSVDIALVNATVTGESNNGDGVRINADNDYPAKLNLTNVSLSGNTQSGSGIHVTGGEKMDFAGTVTMVGTAHNNGVGVTISGPLSVKTEGTKVSISGESASGIGVQVSDTTSLTGGIKLSGITQSGTTGVNIGGKLKMDDKSSVKGEATRAGTGVNLSGSLEGGSVSGKSTTGTGVQLANNAKVRSTVMNGTSVSGSGVSVTGNVSLDDKSAKTLAANSGSGTGLSLENNAVVGVVMKQEDATEVAVTAPVVLTGKSETGSGVATSGNVTLRGTTLTGRAETDGGTGVTLGGNLTFTDDISGVSASATGSGTALKISDGVVDAKGYRDAGRTLVINATSENGTAVSTTGNSSLITVELRGTANGNGSAAVVNGTLSTDKALTAVSKGDKGVGLQLSGGHLQSTAADNTPVKVTVSATGNGTAVAVTEPESGQSGSGLSGIDLNASADKGTVMDIDGDLTTDRDISVSTENGVALSLNGGSLQGAESEHPVTVTVQATGDGTAVTVKPTDKGKPGSSLANMTLHTTSAQGDALNVGGELNTKKVVVEAGTTGTGTALNVSGGEIHSRGETDIEATSDSGHAAVINNGKLTGDSAGALTVKAATKTDSPALDIRGTSDISNSVVSGKNSGNGSAVSVAGVVTSSGGGEIKGQTVNGTAVEIKDGTSVTSSQEGGLLITATASGEKGTGVALSNATLTGSRINADATQGNAVTIADGSITGGNIAGHAHGGVGLNISNAVLSKVVASGTTQTGTGTVINGTLTSDEASQITGTATQDGGNGVNVSGSVTGGKVEGHATSGDAVMVVDGSSVADAEVKGDAGSGTGVSVAGKATLTNASLSGTTQTGAGTVISGTLTSDSTSTITGTATQDGGDGVSLKGQVTGGTVSGHATSGDAVTVADGSSVTDAEVTGDAVSGTGLNVAGKATLTNASLSGTTQTGKGSVIAGSLTADNNSVVSGKATQDGGDGVSVSGNITGGKVEGHATSGNAVNITGAVNHGVIFGEATQGTGVVVNTGSQVTDSAINGNTTEGTGAHWHAGVKHNHVTITGNATSGTGVQIDADTTLKNATVSGSTENGKGVNIAGALVNTGSTTLTGYSSGPGAGVDVAGNISGGSITGNATGTGAGVTVSGQDVKVSDVVVKGNTVNGTGMSVTGNLTGSDSATVTGLATGSGMGVDIGGKLTGTISGSSSSGTGIRVTDGADIVQGSHADGNSESGTGAVIQGSVTNQGSISGQSGSGGGTLIVGTVAGKGDITGTSKGAGEGVILAGNVTGGGIIGQSDGGAGLSISDDSTLTDVTASGFTVTGTGVHVKGNLVNKGGTTVTGAASGNGTGMLLSGSVAGGVINGHSTDGVGVSTDRNVTLTDVAVNGTSVSHSGVQVSSDVTNTGSTVITGSSESGAGVSLNGTVSGGALKGHSVSGPGLHVTGDSQVNSVEVSSSSEQGSEVQMDGNLSSADSSLNGQALQDTVTTDILRQAAYQQQGVISHTARQKHPAMASGYKEQDKPVSVEICADGQCRKLDAGMLARPVRQ
ncbi:TPA: filamentous hemagglutinin N-terminal domain-containing protein [Salmonella enterica subsp. enterica serovar Newport]